MGLLAPSWPPSFVRRRPLSLGFKLPKPVTGYHFSRWKSVTGYKVPKQPSCSRSPSFTKSTTFPHQTAKVLATAGYARKRQGELSDEDGTVTMIAQDRSTWEEAQGGRSMRMLNHGIRQFSARSSNQSTSLDKMSY
jgi:hypothetical protein